jgi:stage II sporulation protein D
MAGKTVVYGIALLLLSAPVPLRAGETIRVAVLSDRPVLSVGAPGRLLIRSSDGRDILRSRHLIQLRPGRSGILINGRPTRRRELVFVADGSVFDLNGVRYSGTLDVRQRPGGLLAVNRVDIETYLKGVVPEEISPDWHPEALKAQAVSARTYALYQRSLRRDREYDLLATTADQVYGGQSDGRTESDLAVEETRGLVAEYDGNLILAAYHSTSAGRTEDAASVWGIDVPYLKGVECPFDRYSPRFQWTRDIPLSRIEDGLRAAGYPVGMIAAVTPVDEDPSGRIGRIRILHSDGELIVSGAEFRRVVGFSALPSTRFFTEGEGLSVRFSGKGSGHGVGLCQWGAKEMAEMGYSYEAILKYYYPGVEIASYAGAGDSSP